ncbi:hypothetical protein NMY22_g8861 [Coprinellus aureogranulatus]|nr:hypothetical protein NMY22_g8861 [Coprinellus aureogranulatus]
MMNAKQSTHQRNDRAYENEKSPKLTKLYETSSDEEEYSGLDERTSQEFSDGVTAMLSDDERLEGLFDDDEMDGTLQDHNMEDAKSCDCASDKEIIDLVSSSPETELSGLRSSSPVDSIARDARSPSEGLTRLEDIPSPSDVLRGWASSPPPVGSGPPEGHLSSSPPTLEFPNNMSILDAIAVCRQVCVQYRGDLQWVKSRLNNHHRNVIRCRYLAEKTSQAISRALYIEGKGEELIRLEQH